MNRSAGINKGHCYWCDKKGLNDEHLFSEWFNDFLEDSFSWDSISLTTRHWIDRGPKFGLGLKPRYSTGKLERPATKKPLLKLPVTIAIAVGWVVLKTNRNLS